jgi:DNA helicase IV
MPIGVSPIIELSKTQHLRVWELAKQWSGDGSIAVLSPFKYENSAMSGQVSGHGITLSKNIADLGKKNTIFFSTIKSFKGIEASTVIIVDLSIPDEHVAFSKEDLYVACTRATTRLALISSKKDVVDYYNTEDV